MIGQERREQVVGKLLETTEPITGSDLARELGVSRQVIVQDIALLRAKGHSIISTADGYLMTAKDGGLHQRVFCVKHPDGAMEDELYSIVDNGGQIINIIISHIVYGEISVDLYLSTRRQVERFLAKTKNVDFIPLMSLTGGEHYHTVSAATEKQLDDIEEELREKGYLVSAHE